MRLAALLLFPFAVGAQTPAIIRGSVRDGAGSPIPGANVFIVGTLDGALTDSAGGFVVSTPRQPRYHVAARHPGYRDFDLVIADSALRPLAIVLRAGAQSVTPVVVQASRYVAADEPGAVLTPLDVVTIPGTAADVNRAIQTLPGVQQVDEGTGLFVRGGDFTETRVYLNDGLLLTPAQVQSPAGTFVGTLDPFLLDAIYFTSGGFGARYGDALSAIAVLNTQGRPTRPSATLSAGLAAFGGNAAVPGPFGTGLRLVADKNNLQPVLRLNGSTRQFFVAPRGADRTISLHWDYRPTARMSLFATEQLDRLGALNETPSVSDTFAVARRERAAVFAWRDVFGRVSPHVVLSSSAIRRTESFGAFDLFSPARLNQAAVALDITLSDRATLHVGGERGRLISRIEGSIPASGADQRPGARVRLYAMEEAANRGAAFVELETRPTDASRVALGLRRDWSSSNTLDPRASASLRLGANAALTAALGVYHQSVDPLLEALADSGRVDLPSMRATQAIVGVQWGESMPMLRVEAYHKRYAHLAQATRDFVTVGDGTGRAHGVDVIGRAPTIAGVSSRLVYSFVRSERTDPNSGAMTRAPFDVPHSLTAIVSRPVLRWITTSASLRYASGRPFTPVASATRPSPRGPWSPTYGAPNSERLPAFARADFSASWFHLMSGGTQTVTYVAVTNVFDRSNVYARLYTADYASRYDVRSIFNRAVYFGGVITFTGK